MMMKIQRTGDFSVEVTIMDKKERAIELKHSGCNCCQSVLMSYADELGMDIRLLSQLGAGFGMGMGCTAGDCGALIGAVMVDNLKNGRRNASAARSILQKFNDRCGAIRCSDLKGITTGKLLCSCDDCVANAVSILEEA